jgi:hypothetical protein
MATTMHKLNLKNGGLTHIGVGSFNVKCFMHVAKLWDVSRSKRQHRQHRHSNMHACAHTHTDHTQKLVNMSMPPDGHTIDDTSQT